MKLALILFKLFFLSINMCCCQGSKIKNSTKLPPITQSAKNLTEDSVINLLISLPEVKNYANQIGKLTSGGNNVSFLIQEFPSMTNDSFYIVNVGRNGSLRFETHFTFSVGVKKDTPVIRILDIESGEFVLIDKWRKKK